MSLSYGHDSESKVAETAFDDGKANVMSTARLRGPEIERARSLVFGE